MVKHAEREELERRRAYVARALQCLHQEQQQLRAQRAQVARQLQTLQRQHAPHQQYDELQQRSQDLLAQFVSTLGQRSLLRELLDQTTQRLEQLQQ